MADIHAFEPLWENWVIDEVIGRGSYGTVWKAHREDPFTHIRQYAAVKHISIPPNETQAEGDIPFHSEESRARYYRNMLDHLVVEIESMVSLRGKPNIVVYEEHKVVPKEQNSGYDLFIRMELLKSIPRYIRDEKRRLTRQEVVRLGVDIASALETLESRNLVHRDIKPDNIFIDDDGHFKLGDFGTSRVLEGSGNATTRIGTPNYTAPEVFTKAMQYDQTVDIYSLGVMLYRYMNNGYLPFMSASDLTTDNALAKRIRGEKMEPPCNADSKLSKIILKACAFRPEDRYQNARELKEDLLKLPEGRFDAPATAKPSAARGDETARIKTSGDRNRGDLGTGKAGSSRRKAVLVCIVALLLLACAGAALFLLNRPAPKYIVTWMNEDGTVLETDSEVGSGQMPEYNGPVPAKAEDARYSYTFSGWIPEITEVSGDAAYTASFLRADRLYTITWLDDTGSLIDTTSAVYGTLPAHADPVKGPDTHYTYSFSGWQPDITAVAGDAVYTAVFTAQAAEPEAQAVETDEHGWVRGWQCPSCGWENNDFDDHCANCGVDRTSSAGIFITGGESEGSADNGAQSSASESAETAAVPSGRTLTLAAEANPGYNRLAWNRIDGAVSYTVMFHMTEKRPEYREYSALAETDGLEYIHNKEKFYPGYRYYYTVVALLPDGETVSSEEVTVVAEKTEPASRPANTPANETATGATPVAETAATPTPGISQEDVARYRRMLDKIRRCIMGYDEYDASVDMDGNGVIDTHDYVLVTKRMLGLD